MVTLMLEMRVVEDRVHAERARLFAAGDKPEVCAGRVEGVTAREDAGIVARFNVRQAYGALNGSLLPCNARGSRVDAARLRARHGKSEEGAQPARTRRGRVINASRPHARRAVGGRRGQHCGTRPSHCALAPHQQHADARQQQVAHDHQGVPRERRFGSQH